jgi:oligopeptide/dipeptide ABC transporter ATP-binding protein
MDSPLLEVRGLKKYFPVRTGFLSGLRGTVRAVDCVDLTIYPGETLGLVGESGCGKSTLGRLILMLDEPTEGSIFFEGEDIRRYTGRSLKDYRRKAQLIFQDPYASLNPRKTAGSIVGEPLLIHEGYDKKEREKKVAGLLEVVGLNREHLERYPHEFSGGQRQRIGIARAVALRPKLIIADEPVSALDVSIQAQVLNLLKDLRKNYGLTYLFITHDLSVVKFISDRIAVMYLGRIVELAANRELYKRPLHPYTMALLSAVPACSPGAGKKRLVLRGDIPGAFDSPAGCAFHARCPFRTDICDATVPQLEEREEGHFVACHRKGIDAMESSRSL